MPGVGQWFAHRIVSVSKAGGFALTLVLGDERVKRLRRQAAEVAARASERLSPVPDGEDPMYLVALAVATAVESDDPIRDVYERVLRRVDVRTVALMFLSLIDEVAGSGPSEGRDGRIRDLACEAMVRFPADVAAAAAARVEGARVLGYSPASSAAWAERRMNALIGQRLEAEWDG